MTAELTSEERALIDAAIAAGKAKKVPTGASGEPYMRWCPKANNIITGLSREDVKRRIKCQLHPRRRPTDPAILAKRARIAEMRRAGICNAEIARVLDTTSSAVEYHIKKMGGLAAIGAPSLVRPPMLQKKPRPKPKPKGPSEATLAARKARADEAKGMLAAHEAGRTSQQIADQFGRCRETVLKTLKRQGVVFTRRHPPCAEMAVRDAKIVAMKRQGMRTTEIAAQLGCSINAAKAVLRKNGGPEGIGYTPDKMGGAKPSAKVAKRREKVAELVAQGMGCVRIAKALGIPRHTASNDIQAVRA